MILQALVTHYEDLLERGEIPEPGWSTARVSFGLNLDKEGNLISLLPLKVEKQKGKNIVYEPREMGIPQQVKKTSGISSNFLCENSTYMLGVDEKGNPDRSAQCFQAFKELHQDILKQTDSEAGIAILKFLDQWKPEKAQSNECIIENWKELSGGANILFFYEGKAITSDFVIRKCWQDFHAKNSLKETSSICMVTGKKEQIATLHPTIKGVYGAQAMGTSLVSFNAPAFCSYGKEQGANASVGEYAAAAYGAALNHLLSDRDHTRSIGDSTVVCWAEGGEEIYQDIAITAMFGTEEDGKLTDQNLRAILEAIAKGMPIREDLTLDMDKHFYILGVAPNAARLSVRFFLQGSFGNVLRNIERHYERLEIVKPLYDIREQYSLRQLLGETANTNTKDKNPSPQMAADTMMAILNGGYYPASLINAVMLRIRADHKITRGRASIIKAFYLRNHNSECPEEVLQVGLNEESTNIPYNLGRLFAILENIQQEANPGINATIKDKYFNSATATPAHVFPLLLSLSEKHLRKLPEGKKIYLSKLQESTMNNLGEDFPVHLSMPQQGSFQLGYYHQTQKRYQKKEEK